MKQRIHPVNIRLTQEEWEHLILCMQKEDQCHFRNGKLNLSEFIRDKLLDRIGYRSQNLLKISDELRYEIRKIGTNINQIARKVNGGFGSSKDLADLKGYVEQIIETFDTYTMKVEELWESQN